MQEGVVYHDEANDRFFLSVEGKESVIDYRKENGMLDIYHTYVPEELRGHGIASQLVKKVLDYASEQDYRVKPTCPFVASFIQRHEEYSSLVA
jgi:predicted GNAT family acetyltransferase